MSELARKKDIAVLVQNADQALADSARPDYRRPLLETPVDRSAVSALYLEACRAGAKRSCWLAMHVQDESGIAEDRVRANCRAGDLMSCRALPVLPNDNFTQGMNMEQLGRKVDKQLSIERRDEGLPGWVGRSTGCRNVGTRCDRSVLQQECDAGFPFSCERIVRLDEPTLDKQGLDYRVPPASVERITGLARRGCQVDLLDECYLLTGWAPSKPDAEDDERLFADERLCRIGWTQCTSLGDLYRARGLPAKAQQAYERACQRGDRPWCTPAAEGYLDGHLPEPVPHRGRDLAAWACQHDEPCRPGFEPAADGGHSP